MKEYRFIKDYKNNDELRHSFSKLAIETFGIDFEPWYKRGFWKENYICYSFDYDNEIVANVSVNYLDVVIGEEVIRAIQLGTVMSDEAHRGQGLVRRLMEKVLDDHRDKYELIYLFANKNVLEFYPKFGFVHVNEMEFSMELDKSNFKICENKNESNMRKLNLDNEEDLSIILRLTSNRNPISKTISVLNDKYLLLFYCIYVFRNDIYYLEEEDCIVLYKVTEDTLKLFDIITENDINVEKVIEKVIDTGIKHIEFQFTPDNKIGEIIKKQSEDDQLFVISKGIKLPEEFVFPKLSHA
ncbi:GNAT family N-acetyltransferase [Oceanirhabdus sp. W0125-5]|uniref:GNAT family N-acetyltransferase n=1 Tax=Oceanirhabdus sp. W0125-5 TaxID=2999116 RepID=UPI0022F2EF5A|nr:GNAT family N-acetyltransferase [Oceanirhabdus sp. W0125-5]WBW97803.1 GNAT family N-acetyltransferase [Oceanirhabdus sp. W0125-5]